MSAYLRVEGKEFDVDRLLSLLELTPKSVRRRGEPNRRGLPYEFSLLSFAVSEADLSNAHQQLHDALDFVRKYDSTLRVLAGFPGIDYRFIDFGIEERDVGQHVDVIPHELLTALGRFQIDLHISRYPRTPPEAGNLV